MHRLLYPFVSSVALVMFLMQCGDGEPAACPEGQTDDGAGGCTQACVGAECEDAGMPDSGIPDGEVPECEDALDCDDSQACTDDACASGMCVNTESPNDTPCVLASGEGVCFEGACVENDPCRGIDCNDGVGCTDDSCSEGVCANTPNDLNCSDGSECTTDTCSAVTGCTNAVIDCDDGNDCTDDRCDPAVGCVIEELEQGAVCESCDRPNNTCRCKDAVCRDCLSNEDCPLRSCRLVFCNSSNECDSVPDSTQEGKDCSPSCFGLPGSCINGSCKCGGE